MTPALAGLPASLEWSLGGGTALAMWLHHRLSKDIDLFFGELRGLIETHIGDLRSRWTVLSARLPEQLQHEVTPVGDGHLVAESLGLLVEEVLSGRQTAEGTPP
nr:nucleotidyl transferase AbiEii/AbiGii toxin family protein [uncultured Rhodopila sp.]